MSVQLHIFRPFVNKEEQFFLPWSTFEMGLLLKKRIALSCNPIALRTAKTHRVLAVPSAIGLRVDPLFRSETEMKMGDLLPLKAGLP